MPRRKVPVVQDEPTKLSLSDFDGPVIPDDEDTTEQAAPAPGISNTELAMAVKALIDATPVKRITFAKRKIRSPFNPGGSRRRKLTRRCYQNGYPMNVALLHDEEIALLNQAVPGKYCNGLVKILVVENGSNTDLHIRYENKTPDQRMANKTEFRDLREMLRRCVQEGSTAAMTASV